VDRTSLARRLLAGSAGLAIGVISMFSMAAPAAAQDEAQTYGGEHEVEKVQLTGEAECDIETETFTVTWSLTNKTEHQATVSSVTSGGEDVEVAGFPLNEVVAGSETINGTQTFPSGTESAELTVELRWAFQVRGEWKEKFASATATVELGECKDDTPPPDEEPEPPALTDAVFFGCDLFVVALRNDDEADGATLQLTPNADVEAGHAPAFIDLIDAAEGEFETPEGFELEDVATLGAGETFTVGPLSPGEAHAHGFEPFAGLVVTAVVLIGEEVVAEAELSWDALLAEKGIECAEEPPGEGGELPVTGNTTLLVAGGAVALLALGGGLFLVARRRRVTFTA
jgi:LPXTG-motif cell wall-anchored protein